MFICKAFTDSMPKFEQNQCRNVQEVHISQSKKDGHIDYLNRCNN